MTRLMCLALLFGLWGWMVSPPPVQAAEFTVEQDDEGVTVLLDGKLLTRYLVRSGTKPILWPIIGPTGEPLTRGFPMRDATPDERTDHVHQRSFWFTHGSVNGVDFWSEGGSSGTIRHREFVRVAGGAEAVIVTRNDWLAPSGERVCEDLRALRFGVDDGKPYIDFDITLTAADGPCRFGDTKEGTFGIRVAASMKVDAKKGGKIVNSEGLTDAAAWGKRAAWVDYHGPVGDERVGIAVMNHPQSFRYPTPWHVRTYGLFAANPFGLRDFFGPGNDGTAVLEKGESLSLYYRVLLHRGDEQEGGVAAAFERYKQVEK